MSKSNIESRNHPFFSLTANEQQVFVNYLNASVRGNIVDKVLSYYPRSKIIIDSKDEDKSKGLIRGTLNNMLQKADLTRLASDNETEASIAKYILLQLNDSKYSTDRRGFRFRANPISDMTIGKLGECVENIKNAKIDTLPKLIDGKAAIPKNDLEIAQLEQSNSFPEVWGALRNQAEKARSDNTVASKAAAVTTPAPSRPVSESSAAELSAKQDRSATKIQALARGVAAKSQLATLKNAAAAKKAREEEAAKAADELSAKQNSFATKIQALARGVAAKSQLATLKNAAADKKAREEEANRLAAAVPPPPPPPAKMVPPPPPPRDGSAGTPPVAKAQGNPPPPPPRPVSKAPAAAVPPPPPPPPRPGATVARGGADGVPQSTDDEVRRIVPAGLLDAIKAANPGSLKKNIPAVSLKASDNLREGLGNRRKSLVGNDEYSGSESDSEFGDSDRKSVARSDTSPPVTSKKSGPNIVAIMADNPLLDQFKKRDQSPDATSVDSQSTPRGRSRSNSTGSDRSDW